MGVSDTTRAYVKVFIMGSTLFWGPDRVAARPCSNISFHRVRPLVQRVVGPLPRRNR